MEKRETREGTRINVFIEEENFRKMLQRVSKKGGERKTCSKQGAKRRKDKKKETERAY